MNRTVCGTCWALYDDEGLCECPQVKGNRMTTLREAAQKTLEVLEDLNSRLHLLDCYRAFDTEVATLRAALEESADSTKPVVESEPQRTLTDEVIADLWHKNGGYHHHFARAIERWLRGN